MTKKIVQVFLVVGATVVAYLVLTVIMPVLTDMASTANTTMAASSNMSNYPGMAAATIGAPLWLYFAPAIVALVIIVLILRQK